MSPFLRGPLDLPNVALGFAPNAGDVACGADLIYDELLILDHAWRAVKKRAHDHGNEIDSTDTGALSKLVEKEDSNENLLRIINRGANPEDSATRQPQSLWERLQGLAKQPSLFGFFAYEDDSDSDQDAPSPTFFSFDDFISVLSEAELKDSSSVPGSSRPPSGQLQGGEGGRTTLHDIVVAITKASSSNGAPRENYFYLRSCLSGSSGVAVHTSRWRAVVATSSSSLDVGGGEGRASDLTPQQLAFSLFFQPAQAPEAETRAAKLIELAEALEAVNEKLLVGGTSGLLLEQDLLDFEQAFKDAAPEFFKMGLLDTRDDHRFFVSDLGVAGEGLAKMCRDFIPRWNAMHEIVRTAAKLDGLLKPIDEDWFERETVAFSFDDDESLEEMWLQGQEKSMVGNKGANQLRVYVFDKLWQHVTVWRGVAEKMGDMWKGIVEPAKRIGLFGDPTAGRGAKAKAFGHDIGEPL